MQTLRPSIKAPEDFNELRVCLPREAFKLTLPICICHTFVTVASGLFVYLSHLVRIIQERPKRRYHPIQSCDGAQRGAQTRLLIHLSDGIFHANYAEIVYQENCFSRE